MTETIAQIIDNEGHFRYTNKNRDKAIPDPIRLNAKNRLPGGRNHRGPEQR